jgi:hypothetical protein
MESKKDFNFFGGAKNHAGASIFSAERKITREHQFFRRSEKITREHQFFRRSEKSRGSINFSQGRKIIRNNQLKSLLSSGATTTTTWLLTRITFIFIGFVIIYFTTGSFGSGGFSTA